jgi:hypothetical protein
LQTDEESKRSELSPSAPLESSHAPEQAFQRRSSGEAGDDIALLRMGRMDGNLYDSQSSKYSQPTFSR